MTAAGRSRRRQRIGVGDRRLRLQLLGKDVGRLSRANERARQDLIEADVERARGPWPPCAAARCPRSSAAASSRLGNSSPRSAATPWRIRYSSNVAMRDSTSDQPARPSGRAGARRAAGRALSVILSARARCASCGTTTVRVASTTSCKLGHRGHVAGVQVPALVFERAADDVEATVGQRSVRRLPPAPRRRASAAPGDREGGRACPARA